MSADQPPRVLVVEDRVEFADTLRLRIERELGLTTDVETDGQRAAERILTEQPDLVVLDVGLPTIDGYEVCRRVRPGFRGRILFLTAMATSSRDQIRGLEIGGDDFVIKPAELDVLLARIKVLLRRLDDPASELQRLEVGSLTLDRANRRASFSESELDLTAAEFDALWQLACCAGRPCSRSELAKAVGREATGGNRSVDVLIHRLRRKLDCNGQGSRVIRSIHGVGYQLGP